MATAVITASKTFTKNQKAYIASKFNECLCDFISRDNCSGSKDYEIAFEDGSFIGFTLCTSIYHIEICDIAFIDAEGNDYECEFDFDSHIKNFIN